MVVWTMKTGKEIILEHCSKILNTITIDYLQTCEDIKRWIETGDIESIIQGCPNNYGLENFTGDCEFEDVSNDISKIVEQCKRCWDRALNIIESS